ncbi:MAG: cytochrome c biogenesis protein CcsA [Abditibacteriales bacterium]|nr:cytochrome c biogenesis protein CcsA [Abditibacteriales bacterium]MDW8366910.1 cytochrome c biogenesis protein CcsA [Abditibacteriales bacterium]
MKGHEWLLMLVLLAYLAATMGYQAEIFFKVKGGARGGRILLLGAVVLQGIALVGHTLALRTAPFANAFTAANFFVWLLLVAFLLVEKPRRLTALGAFVTPMAFFVSLVAFAVRMGRAGSPARFDSPWLVVHVVLIGLGFVGLGLAFCLALVYLTSEKMLKTKHVTGTFRYLPSLQITDQLVLQSTTIGLALMTVGLAIGFYGGMTHTFIAPWRDGRILLSAFTWLLFALYLCTRRLLGWQGSKAHWMIVAGFAVFVLTLMVYQFRP